MSETRIVELETLVAFHEETIAELSHGLHKLYAKTESLEKRLKHTEEKLAEVGGGNVLSPDQEVPPPHY